VEVKTTEVFDYLVKREGKRGNKNCGRFEIP